MEEQINFFFLSTYFENKGPYYRRLELKWLICQSMGGRCQFSQTENCL